MAVYQTGRSGVVENFSFSVIGHQGHPWLLQFVAVQRDPEGGSCVVGHTCIIRTITICKMLRYNP